MTNTRQTQNFFERRHMSDTRRLVEAATGKGAAQRIHIEAEAAIQEFDSIKGPAEEAIRRSRKLLNDKR